MTHATTEQLERAWSHLQALIPMSVIRTESQYDQALETLATFDARKVRVIELRFFSGLTVEETAQVLDVSADTVARDWRMARTWLMRQLNLGLSS